MTSKDVAKIGIAVAILAVAVVIYVRLSKSNAADAEDAPSYWFCTKTNKAFQISGKEYDDNVRTGRLMPEPNPDGRPVIRRSTDIVTVAKSPYTHDWTGIPAAKCEKCGEIFPLDTTGKKENACPKCHWIPGKGMPEKQESAESAEGKGG